MKKRILIVTDVLETICGGAEKQIYLLSSGLVQRGWKVSILVLQSECKDVELFEKVGVEVFVEDVKRVYSRSGWLLAKHWSDRLKEENFGAVLSYHFGSDLWCALCLNIPRDVKWFSMRRDDGFWMKWYHKFVYRYFINRKICGICVVAEFMKDNVCIREGADRNKIWVVYNGIDLSQFNKNVVGNLENRNEFVLVCVANLSSVKNHCLLVNGVSQLKVKIPGIKMWFVGEDRGEEKNLKKMVKDLELSGVVEFLGLQRDIPAILNRADVCVLASKSEGMSNTLLEYMAAGKPIVCSDIPSNREVIGDVGLYFHPNDVDSFCNSIMWLYADASFRADLAKRARFRVESMFSIDVMLDRYEKLIMEARL